MSSKTKTRTCLIEGNASPWRFVCPAATLRPLPVVTMISFVFLIFGCTSQDLDKLDASSVFSDARVVSLVLAAEVGDVDKIDTLVKDGVDVNAVGRSGMTPLLRTVFAGNKKGYAQLLKHGADPNKRDSRGFSAVYNSASEEDSFWLREALAHGGDANLVNEGNRFCPGETPLYRAISEKRIENVKILIKAKANVDQKNKAGSFPLLRAAGRQSYDVVFALLEAGADFNQTDGNGDSLVQWVAGPNGKIIEDEEQKRWFEKTVEFLRTKRSKQ